MDRKTPHLLGGSSKNLIRPTGLKLSREEVLLCLVQALRLTVALTLMLVVVAMDHVAFSMADTAVRKVAHLSVVPFTLSIKYSVSARSPPAQDMLLYRLLCPSNQALPGAAFLFSVQEGWREEGARDSCY